MTQQIDQLQPFWAQRGLSTAIGRWSGVALLVLLAVGTVMQMLVFRSLAGAGLLAAIVGLNAVLSPYLTVWLRPDPFRLATILFLAVGAAAIVLSINHVYPASSRLPVADDYILRHGYFVVFWLPILLGGVHLWISGLGGAIRFAQRWGMAALVIIMVADLGTSLPLRGGLAGSSVGYVFFMEKVSTAFLFSTIYLLRIAFGGRSWLPFLLATVYFLICRILHIGIMFNASTGLFIYAVLAVASLTFLSPRRRAWMMIGGYLLIVAVLAVGMFIPERFEADLNTYLRLVWWRDNFVSLWDSGLLGVGFGTPYFPVTAENLETAQRLAESAASFEWAFWDPLDALYVRAQHSSIVNMFYRLGIVGGALFVFLNVWLFARLMRVMRAPDPFLARLGFVAFAGCIINLFQITMHVGLESPRFFLVYLLAVALACLAIEIDRSQVRRLVGAAPARAPAPDPVSVATPSPGR